MAVPRDRKQSQFLLELDKYYNERQKYSNSFADAPCPQNFIPGATKAKPVMKVVRTVSRKLSSVCYKGVIVQVKDNMTAVEKGTIPGGILALAFPSPSQHTSCLEHKMEQILQRNSKLLSSISSEVLDFVESEDIHQGEDEALLVSRTSKKRGCSLPTTKRDIGDLPIMSSDDHSIVTVFSDIIDQKRNRRNSYPLTNDEFEAFAPHRERCRKFDNITFDSAARLGAFCRGASYYGSLFESSGNLLGKGRELALSSIEEGNVEMVFDRSPNYQRLSTPSGTVEEDEPETARQAEVLEKDTSKVTNDAIHEQRSRDKGYCSDPEMHIYSLQSKRSSGKSKGIMKRFSRKKANAKNNGSEVVKNTSKETLSQIQSALRAKLPKTFQTTVNVGLSFDPVTVKERNSKSQETATLPRVRKRSRSLTSSPQLIPRNERSRTINTIMDVPSLLVSPPTMEGSDDVSAHEGSGVFASLLKLGKDTLTRKRDRWSSKKTKNILKSASATNFTLYQSVSEKRARKLENLLGAEFKEVYSKERCNSLPLISNKRVSTARLSTQHGSTLEIGKQENTSCLPPSFDMSSSLDTSDSDVSYIQANQEVSRESEFSDFDEQYLHNAAQLENELEKVISTHPGVILIRNAADGVRVEQKSTGMVADITAKELGDSKHLPGSQMKNMPSSEKDGRNSYREEIYKRKEDGSQGISPFRVETSYVLNKNMLLKTSKELVEEWKGQQVENGNLVKKSRRKKCRNYNEDKGMKGQNDGSFDGGNAVLDKPLCREHSNEKTVATSSDDERMNEANGIENGCVKTNEKSIEMACESELKELEALLTELEIYSMN